MNDLIEKVKQGLQLCSHGECPIQEECPYGAEDWENCMKNMSKDSLSVIEQMEQEIERLKVRLNVYEWENGDRKDGDGE